MAAGIPNKRVKTDAFKVCAQWWGIGAPLTRPTRWADGSGSGGCTVDQSVIAYVSLGSTVVVTVATVVLAILTRRYVMLTGSLVEESRRLHDPVVTVDFELPDFIVLLVIENHGVSPARNVRLVLQESGPWLRGLGEGEGLSDTQPFQSGVSYLTPGRRLKYQAGTMDWKAIGDAPAEVVIRLSYESLTGEQFEHTIRYDFRQLSNVMFESFRDPNDAIAKAIHDAESSRRSDGKMGQMMRQMSAPEMKPCEMCAEPIRADAKKCKHCGSMQEPARPTSGSSGRRSHHDKAGE